MKYIDSDHLIDKILQLQKEYAQTEAKEDHQGMKAVLGGQCYTLTKVVKIIESLQDEQPEVDLEKEIDNFLNKTGIPYVWCNDEEQKEWCDIIARHFYELGLKTARKED